MTGPEHYREAERLLDDVGVQARDIEAITLSRAQVHATLALAAATALNDAEVGLQQPDLAAWRDIASTQDGES